MPWRAAFSRPWRCAFLVACIALFALDLATLRGGWSAGLGGTVEFHLGQGGFWLRNAKASSFAPHDTIWWSSFERPGRARWQAVIPVWPFILALAIAAAPLFLPEARRRGPPTCAKCGYSLKGLPYLSRCPECDSPWPCD